VCGAGFGSEIRPRDLRRLCRYGIETPLRISDPNADALLQEAVTEVQAYFASKLQVFTVPIDLRGTPFQLAVWEHLIGVPYGKTRSYGEIALELENAQASQAVGQAVGANPVALIVPCHRIVGHDGGLTGYAGGVERKAALLELESYGYQLPMPELPQR